MSDLTLKAPTKAAPSQAAHVASVLGLNFGSVIAIGTRVVSALLGIAAGQPADETIKGIHLPGGQSGDLELVWHPHAAKASGMTAPVTKPSP